MHSLLRKIRNLAQKLTIRSVVLCVVSVSVFGFFFCVNMNMVHVPMAHDHHSTAVSDCSPTGLLPCAMDVSEHLSQWESRFIALTTNIFADLLLGAVLLVSIFALVRGDQLLALPQKHLSYSGDKPIDKLNNYLIRLFARGILARKLYA